MSETDQFPLSWTLCFSYCTCQLLGVHYTPMKPPSYLGECTSVCNCGLELWASMAQATHLDRRQKHERSGCHI